MEHAHCDRRREALDYMQSMLGQLRAMAEAERFDMLTYLIEMAYIEAIDIMRGTRPAQARDNVNPARDPKTQAPLGSATTETQFRTAAPVRMRG